VTSHYIIVYKRGSQIVTNI